MILAFLFAAALQSTSVPPILPPPILAVPSPRPTQPPRQLVEEDWYSPAMINRENCPVPRPDNDERFILLGFYEGAAVADRAVAGLKEETTTGTIKVLPGRTPIFLVISSHDPMVFRFTGSVERLTNVVIVHAKGGGVTGVSARKARFGIGLNCQLGYSFDKDASGRQSAAEIFGRQPDSVGGAYELDQWILPGENAGASVPTLTREDRYQGNTALERERSRFYPGGVIRIDARSLVSSATADRYQVLPSTAGAVQLEQSGSMVAATDEEVSAWKQRAEALYGKKVVGSVTPFDAYRVVSPIELPIGLCGAHALTFLVPSEAFVRGDPCHSEILAIDGRILTPRRQAELRSRQRFEAEGSGRPSRVGP